MVAIKLVDLLLIKDIYRFDNNRLVVGKEIPLLCKEGKER